MNSDKPLLIKRLWVVSFSLMLVLLIAMFLGLSLGSSQSGMKAVFQNLFGIEPHDPMLDTIIWKIRFPRILLAALVGGTLSLGGLVFQALLKNPLAEPGGRPSVPLSAF